MASGRIPPSREQMAFDVVTLASLMNVLGRQRVHGGKLRDEFFSSSPNWVRQSNALLERYAAGLSQETRQWMKNNTYDHLHHLD